MENGLEELSQIRPRLTHLELERVPGPGGGDVHVVGDEDVVEVDVAGHGPQLDAHRADRGHAREGVGVVVVVRVGNAPRLPLALVRRVRDQGRVPLPLVTGRTREKSQQTSWVLHRDGTVPRTGSQPPKPELNQLRTGSSNLPAQYDSVQNQ